MNSCERCPHSGQHSVETLVPAIGVSAHTGAGAGGRARRLRAGDRLGEWATRICLAREDIGAGAGILLQGLAQALELTEATVDLFEMRGKRDMNLLAPVRVRR